MFLRWKRQTVTRAQPLTREKEFRDCEHPAPVVRVTPQVLEAYRDGGVSSTA